MFKFRPNNSANHFELSVENFATKMAGGGEFIRDSIIRAKVDYPDKLITFDVYDLAGGLTEQWFQNLEEDPQLRIRLSMYRRDGSVDYVKRFDGGKLIERSLVLDTADSGPALHKVKLSYETTYIERFMDFDDD